MRRNEAQTTWTTLAEKISRKCTGPCLTVLVLMIFLIMGQVALSQPSSGSRSSGTRTSEILGDYIKRHANETPPASTQRKLKRYEPYIKYFSSLHFSQYGVKVSGNFLRALISAESAADPYAISDKNAYGLSQITIETGRLAAKELYKTKFDFKYVDEEKLKDLQQSDLFDPAINILICSYLIDKYNNQFGNNIALTVSAWNAGPGSVIQYKGYPPYEETLTLIARVNSYYRYYMQYYL